MLEVEKRFQDFIKNIKKTDKIAILFHSDADGVPSAVIVAKTIERLHKKKIDYYFSQGLDYPLTEGTGKALKERKITKFIVVDQAVDTKPETIKPIEEFAEVLILDHHAFEHDVNSKKTILFKAQMQEGCKEMYYPCAKFVYDVCSKLINIEDLDWVACVGILSDMGYKEWQKFVDSTLRKYNLKVTERILDCEIGKVGDLINAAKTYSAEKLPECFEVLYAAKDHKDVVNSKLKEYKKEVVGEMNKWIYNFDEQKNMIDKQLVLYEIKPKFAMHSPVSTILSVDYMKNNTLIVVADYGNDMLYLSARRQDKKIMANELMKKSLEGLEKATGGGHPAAAGGNVLKKDYETFRKRLLTLHREMLKKLNAP